jgi:hypothetical protein
MKYIIPVSFILSGSVLLGLPLYSQISALNVVSAIMQQSGGSQIGYSPLAPYIHFIVCWIAGFSLLSFGIHFAFKSYKD